MKLFMKILLLMLTLACMMTIFAFSAQTAEKSNSISMSVSEKLTKTADSGNSETDGSAEAQSAALWRFNGVVRKYAHFIMYFVLGSISIGFFASVMPKKTAVPLLCALGLCLLWAVLDEVHQMYVPGRTGRIRDIMIDFAGAGLAVFIVTAVRCAVKKRKRDA